MIVLRFVGVLASGLLLASCASQIDISKYALLKREGSASPPRLARTDINPDGTLVKPYPVQAQRGRVKYAAEELAGGQSDPTPPRIEQRDGPTSLDPLTAGASSGRSQGQFQTPLRGSDRWKKEEAENDRLDKQLNARLQRAICTKC